MMPFAFVMRSEEKSNSLLLSVQKILVSYSALARGWYLVFWQFRSNCSHLVKHLRTKLAYFHWTKSVLTVLSVCDVCS